ncbi:MAG: FRG domain-containing protein [Legionellales bacterium]|jgi:hypothetical protein
MNAMIIDANKLISKLQALRGKEYLFRGHSDAGYWLQPKAFRPDGKKELQEKFKGSSWKTWISSQEIQSIFGPHVDKMLAERICELGLYMLQYNYTLAKKVESNVDNFDAKTIEKYQMQPPDFWIQKDAFVNLVQRLSLSIIGKVHLDGTVLQYSEFYEFLTAFDESFPQHYGVPTAALDWTYDPYVALSFALEFIPENAKYISIWVYEKIRNSEHSPVKISHASDGCNNPRIKRQHGTFTRFDDKAFAFYFLKTGKFPRIEEYEHHSDAEFKLFKYDISVEEKYLLEEALKREGIKYDYHYLMCPDIH